MGGGGTFESIEKYKKIGDPVIFPKKNIKILYVSILSKVPPPPIYLELSEDSSKDIIFILYFPRTLQYLFSYVHVLFNTHFFTFHAFTKQ